MRPRSRSYRSRNQLPDVSVAAMRLFVLALTGIWLFASDAKAQASRDDAIQRGIDFLLLDQADVGPQDDDGAWGAGEQRLMVTVEVLRTLDLARDAGFAVDDAALTRVIPFVAAIEPSDTERISLKLVGQLAAGVSASATRSQLLVLQQSDGGWGLDSQKQSNIVDTLSAIDALIGHEAGISLPLSTRVAARDYLVATQLVEGSGSTAKGHWRVTDNEAHSDVVRTARGLLCLVALGHSDASTAASEARERAARFLEDKLGRPEAAELSIAERSLIVRALAAVRQPAQLQFELGTIMGAQAPEGATDAGSWGGDSHTTALAVHALLATRPPPDDPRPDLVLLAQAIRFDPSSGMVDATVFNSGPVDAPESGVGLYSHDPFAGGMLYQVVPTTEGIPAGGSRTVSFFAPPFFFDAPPAGSETTTVVLIADHANFIEELDEANNAATFTLAFTDAPPDFAVGPQSLQVTGSGAAAQLSVTVHQLGGAPSDEITIEFYLDDINVASFERDVPAGAPVTVPYSAGNVGLGPHEFRVTLVDPLNTTGEVNTENNEAVMDFEGSQGTGLNLAINAVHPPAPESGIQFLDPVDSTPIIDPSIGSMVKVKVVGTSANVAGQDFELRLARGDPRSLAPTDPDVLATETVSAIGAIWSHTFADPIPIPHGFGDGTHIEIGAWIDSGHAAVEDSEEDNVAIRTYDVARAADLSVRSIGIHDGDGQPVGRPVGLFGWVYNVGSEDAHNVTARFTTTDALDNVVPIAEVPIGTMEPGLGIRIVVVWIPTREEQPATMEAVTNPAQQELSTANNALERTFGFTASEGIPIEFVGGPHSDTVVSPASYGPSETIYVKLDETLLIDASYFYRVDLADPAWATTAFFTPIPDTVNRFQLSTGSLPPGVGYHVVARLFTGNSLVTEGTADMEIRSEGLLASPALFIEPDFLFFDGGNVEPGPQRLLLQTQNRSNVPFTVVVTPRVEYEVDGQTHLLTNPPPPFQFDVEPSEDEITVHTIAENWAAVLPQVGRYNIFAEFDFIGISDQPPPDAATSFYAGQATRLILRHRVRPLSPDVPPAPPGQLPAIPARDGERVEVTIIVEQPSGQP